MCSEPSVHPLQVDADKAAGSASADYLDAAWLSSFLRPLLIALVASSVIQGPVAMLGVFGVRWMLGYVFPLAFFIALVGVYSTLRLGRPAWRHRRGLAYRLGELIVLLIVFRVSSWAFSLGWPTTASVAHWLREPLAFLDGHFLLIGTCIVVAWGLAVAMASDFLRSGAATG